MKSLSQAADQAEILARLENISPSHPRKWGKMTVHQMICHLCDSFRGPMGEKPLSLAKGYYARGLIRHFALYVPLKWPKNVPTRPEMDQQVSGTPPVEFAADLREFRRLFNRFTAQPRDFKFVSHPIFGPMSDADWMRWGYLHIDHHLRQFGV